MVNHYISTCEHKQIVKYTSSIKHIIFGYFFIFFKFFVTSLKPNPLMARCCSLFWCLCDFVVQRSLVRIQHASFALQSSAFFSQSIRPHFERGLHSPPLALQRLSITDSAWQHSTPRLACSGQSPDVGWRYPLGHSSFLMQRPPCAEHGASLLYCEGSGRDVTRGGSEEMDVPCSACVVSSGPSTGMFSSIVCGADRVVLNVKAMQRTRTEYFCKDGIPANGLRDDNCITMSSAALNNEC